MRSSTFFAFIMASSLGLAASGCASVTPIAYAPQPARVSAPEKELEATINLGVDPPVKVEVTDTFVKTIFAGTGVVTKVLNFSKIASLKLVKSSGPYEGIMSYDGAYVVEVRDAAGEKIFFLGLKDVDSGQRLIDELEALRVRAAAKH
jgi:hypothetical protein